MASSFPLLLCVSMFVAISSVGYAWDYDYDYDYHFDDTSPVTVPAPAPGPEPELDPFECAAVNGDLSACQDYLTGNCDAPSEACCDKLLDLWVITYDVDPKKICECTKDLRASFIRARAETEVYKKCEFEEEDFHIPITEQQCSAQ